jgi:hypothetical protein
MLRADSKIFIAYEDPGSFSAISKFDGFPEVMPKIPNPESSEAIDFSHFWTEESWGNAVTAVTRADVIIVSLSGQSDLPVPVRRWMETWPHYKQAHQTTLLVVFATEINNASKQNVLISYFQQVAEKHGLDFLCNCECAKALPTRLQSSKRADPVDVSPSHTELYPAFNPSLATLKAA